MGNCLKRNRSNDRNNSDYYMGFRVVTVDDRPEILKAISRCKKRKSSRNSDGAGKKSLKGINDKINNIFDYEEPLGTTFCSKISFETCKFRYSG